MLGGGTIFLTRRDKAPLSSSSCPQPLPMADYVPLPAGDVAEAEEPKPESTKSPRLVSLDVFRGLSIALMIFVDYAGSIFPCIAHSPWNGVQLADFVMPFFLFIAGVSLALVYKKISNRVQATCKVVMRAVKLFLLGVLLQGGYFHGLNSLTYGVNVEEMRWLGILQRIAIGYIVAALCEIWSSTITKKNAGGFFKNYLLHWLVVFSLSCIYMGLLYGLYVPDWQYKVQVATSLVSNADDYYVLKMVKCGVRGNLGPACNSAGMIDRCILGIEHLYKKPVYRNLKECRISSDGQISDDVPSWCQAPFDPEGILSSFMAAVTCIIGLHFGHVLVQLKGHKDRLVHWLLFSVLLFSLGLILVLIGIPLNKSLYSISYMLLTTASAGVTFCVLYFLVDVHGYRCLTFVLEWMGRHSLSIFILVPSNIAIILIQGFYWRKPANNLVHLVVSFVVHK